MSSDLLRNQVDGLKGLFKDGRGFSLFEIKDGFTDTGAARTFELNVQECFRSFMNNCLYGIHDKLSMAELERYWFLRLILLLF